EYCSGPVIAVKKFADDSRARSDAHFYHDQAQIGFHRIWADAHTLRHFLTGEPDRDTFQNLLFARSEAALSSDLKDCILGRGPTLQTKRQQWGIQETILRLYLVHGADILVLL